MRPVCLDLPFGELGYLWLDEAKTTNMLVYLELDSLNRKVVASLEARNCRFWDCTLELTNRRFRFAVAVGQKKNRKQAKIIGRRTFPLCDPKELATFACHSPLPGRGTPLLT
jgi:hypothetical protein